MSINTTQLRVTLPVKLQASLQERAERFGLSMSAYVRSLILDDVKNIPTKQASKTLELVYKEAKQAEKDGKLIEVSNLQDLLAKL
jgi:hypothetical protein